MTSPAWQLVGPHDSAEIGVKIAHRLPGGTNAVLGFDERGRWDERATIPLDRPDDELVYETMFGAAQAHGTLLLDWYIIAGQESWSGAEFTPSGAGWDALGRRGSSFTAEVSSIRRYDKP